LLTSISEISLKQAAVFAFAQQQIQGRKEFELFLRRYAMNESDMSGIPLPRQNTKLKQIDGEFIGQ